jgi:hypothetical protein
MPLYNYTELRGIHLILVLPYDNKYLSPHVVRGDMRC